MDKKTEKEFVSFLPVKSTTTENRFRKVNKKQNFLAKAFFERFFLQRIWLEVYKKLLSY